MTNEVYQKSLEYRLRTFGKRYYLFAPHGKNYEVNEVGKMVWENINGEKKLSEIISEVINTYDVDENIAQADVKHFVKGLQKVGAIL